MNATAVQTLTVYSTPTPTTTMHSVTDRDGRHHDANSQSECVYITVRSAKYYYFLCIKMLI